MAKYEFWLTYADAKARIAPPSAAPTEPVTLKATGEDSKLHRPWWTG